MDAAGVTARTSGSTTRPRRSSACARSTALPEAYEEQSWAGRRWRIRKRTFADLRTADTETGLYTFIKFRSRGPELDALLQSGHPFFPAGYGAGFVGMVLDANTDWTELAEVLTESYRLFAPKRLALRLRD